MHRVFYVEIIAVEGGLSEFAFNFQRYFVRIFWYYCL